MTPRMQALCGWLGLLSTLISGVGIGWLAKLSPPVSALVGAEEIAAKFRDNPENIMVGSFCLLVGAALSLAFIGCISMQILRMRIPNGPIYSAMQAIWGGLAGAFISLPPMIWSVAAFRPERSAETIQLLDEIAGFIMYLPSPVAILNAWVIGAAILSDRSSKPFYPRWVAYLNIVAGISYIPLATIGLFKTGPFAGDGLIGYTIPTSFLFAWMVIMSIYMIKNTEAWTDYKSEDVAL